MTADLATGVTGTVNAVGAVSAAFRGADADALRGNAQRMTQAAQVVDEVKTACQAIVAASFFLGPFGASFIAYLEHTVIPWLTKVSQALQLLSKVLSFHAGAQDDAQSPASLPSYTSPGDATTVLPVAGSTGQPGASAGSTSISPASLPPGASVGLLQIPVAVSPDGQLTPLLTTDQLGGTPWGDDDAISAPSFAGASLSPTSSDLSLGGAPVATTDAHHPPALDGTLGTGTGILHTGAGFDGAAGGTGDGASSGIGAGSDGGAGSGGGLGSGGDAGSGSGLGLGSGFGSGSDLGFGSGSGANYSPTTPSLDYAAGHALAGGLTSTTLPGAHPAELSAAHVAAGGASHDGLFAGLGQATGIGAGAAALARAIVVESRRAGVGPAAPGLPADAQSDAAPQWQIFDGTLG